MTTLYFDQIDKLKLELAEKLLQDGKLNERECIDAVYEILVLAYVYGVDDVNEMLGVSDTPNADRLRTALEKKYEGKDFADRVKEYARTGDIEAIGVVAETDAHRLYNIGAFGVALDNGATTKTWNTQLDDRVRDTHDFLEGVQVPMDTTFVTFDDDEAMYPGDFSKPQNNVSCRCYLAFNK